MLIHVDLCMQMQYGTRCVVLNVICREQYCLRPLWVVERVATGQLRSVVSEHFQ